MELHTILLTRMEITSSTTLGRVQPTDHLVYLLAIHVCTVFHPGGKTM
jgi:hypothetical protein